MKGGIRGGHPLRPSVDRRAHRADLLVIRAGALRCRRAPAEFVERIPFATAAQAAFAQNATSESREHLYKQCAYLS
jgi:hypothetical protein